MPTMTELQVFSFEDSMTRLKKLVYKTRLRLKEFLCDFDRLRSGVMHENHFITALSIAGVDRRLSPQQINTIVENYRVQVTPSLSMIDWISFVEDVEQIFTSKGLEKNPSRTIPTEPLELLDKTRYKVCARVLDPDREARIQCIIADLSSQTAKRGILVKNYFEDASRDPNSIRLVNHVTPSQFKQVLNVKLALDVEAQDLELLIDKYLDEEYGDLVNYVAFASSVDHFEQPFDPYTLGH